MRKSRFYFSENHIQSACQFVRLAFEIENNCEKPSEFYIVGYSNENLEKHRACVLGAIFSTTAFLEATINELFADTVEESGRYLDNLNPNVKRMMGQLWNLKVPRTAYFPIAQKYQIALSLAGKEQFDIGTNPYQDVEMLIKLRNKVIHYEPEWIIENKEHIVESRLKGKFETCKIVHEKEPFFPMKCLSYGCADWAVRTAISFTDMFFNKMGLEPNYNRETLLLKLDIA